MVIKEEYSKTCSVVLYHLYTYNSLNIEQFILDMSYLKI